MKRFLLCLSLGCMVCLMGVQNGYAGALWDNATDDGWKMPGLARDVAIGGTGAANDDIVWMIEKATPRRKRGGVVCQWIPETQSWQRYPEITGEHITVDQGGVAWVADSDGKLYKWNKFDKKFELISAGASHPAKDIAVGKNGNPYYIWVIDRNDNQIYQWIGGGSWYPIPFPSNLGIPARIDIDMFDRPWIVTEAGLIFFFNGYDDNGNPIWINYSVTVKNGRRYTMYATDISVDLNGWEVWITTKANRPEAGRLYYTLVPDQEVDPIPPAYWYMGPDNKGTRLDASEGEIIVCQSTGEIWWVSLE